jgi:uncharacterized protein (DUF488 family)
MASRLWTVGHSTHSIEEFIQILSAFSIELLVDVRTFPSSRRYPQYNKQELQQALLHSAIKYCHLPELGGRRKPSLRSKNTAWRNASFRGYADYMETESFKNGVQSLMDLANSEVTAIMCAESLWWRCHRSLISDYFKAKGWEVVHILNETRAEPHPYTSAAGIVNGKLSYAGLLGAAEVEGET